jgi:exodeoxyribonuclease VII small subunit
MEPKTSFETSLDQLVRTVEQLESGKLGLDDSLAAYERGVRLVAHCHGMLNEAERKVALLVGVNEDGSAATRAFDTAEASSSEAATESSAGRASRKRARDRDGTAPRDDEIPY